MGGEYFEVYAAGTDPEALFAALVEKAFYDHGHGGYTGTICEKPGFDIVSEVAMPKKWSEAWAWNYEQDNPNGKWGNAYAVPVCHSDERQEVIGYLFFGVASS